MGPPFGERQGIKSNAERNYVDCSKCARCYCIGEMIGDRVQESSTAQTSEMKTNITLYETWRLYNYSHTNRIFFVFFFVSRAYVNIIWASSGNCEKNVQRFISFRFVSVRIVWNVTIFYSFGIPVLTIYPCASSRVQLQLLFLARACTHTDRIFIRSMHI